MALARNLITRKNGSKWLPCIGLEIHAQILTDKKLFSRADMPLPIPNNKPNSYVSLLDASIPGVYPQINKHAVKQAIKAALVLNCEINKKSYFERKHYFYHDMPQGYQITQQEQPIAFNGMVNIAVDKDDDNLSSSIDLKIDRIQLEQDSGKTIYDKTGANIGNTAVDLNRAGVGLLELVFAPQLNSPSQAVATLSKIQHLFKHLNICDGKIELGNMRCDVNISVAPYGENGVIELGERVEVKNLNGQNNIYNAIQYEIKRQINILEKNEKIFKETRGYNDIYKTTTHMRYKESQVDYRFFPDPDLKVLEISSSDIEYIKQELILDMNNLPEIKSISLQKEYGLEKAQADYIVSRPLYCQYFLEMIEINKSKIKDTKTKDSNNKLITPVFLYNWIVTDLHGLLSNYYSDYNTMVNILSMPTVNTSYSNTKNTSIENEGNMMQRNVDDLLHKLPISPSILYEIVYLVSIQQKLSNLQAKKLVTIIIEKHLNVDVFENNKNNIQMDLNVNTVNEWDDVSNPAQYVMDLAEKYELLQNSDLDMVTRLCIDSVNDESNASQLKRFVDGTLKLQAKAKTNSKLESSANNNTNNNAKNDIKQQQKSINPTWKYFFGDIMKRSHGKANPKLVEQLLIPLLMTKL